MAVPKLNASLIAYATLRQTTNYINVACLALLLFDCIETFDREVELIWKAKWNLGKVIFLLARYSMIVGFVFQLYSTMTPNISIEFCPIIVSMAGTMLFFGICAAQVILILRTYALWERNRRLLVFLFMVYIIEVIAIITTLVLYRRLGHFRHLPSPPFTGCYPVVPHNLPVVDFLSIMVMEATILFVSLWIGFQKYEIWGSPSRLVVVLYRDGILFYICISSLALANILVVLFGPQGLCMFATSLQRVMHSVLPTRIVLHVREANALPEVPVNLSDFEMQLSLGAPPSKARPAVDLCTPPSLPDIRSVTSAA